VRHFWQHPYDVTINSHNGQLTLHTDSHRSDSDAERLEGIEILSTESRLLYNEIALSRKAFGIGYMYIYTFLLRLTETMTSQNIDLFSWEPRTTSNDTTVMNASFGKIKDLLVMSSVMVW
jgi:hypothetical protein